MSAAGGSLAETAEAPGTAAGPAEAARHSRTACLVAATVVLALLAIPALYHAVYGVRGSDLRRWGEWLRTRPAGEALRAIDGDFDKRFLLSFVARAWTERVPALVPKPVETGTVRGTDGFLYLNRDNLVCTSAGFLDPRIRRAGMAAEQLIDLDRQLKERGIHLVVVPVPAKLSIYPDHLYPKYDVRQGPFVNVDNARWFEKLHAAGVDAVDLAGLLWAHRYDARGLMYYKTDSHWTDLAKRLAAMGPVGESVRPWVAGAPRVTFRTRAATRVFEGNLVTIGNLHRHTPLYTDGDVREEVVQVVDGDGTPVIPKGEEAPVLVIGDSTADLGVVAGYGFSQRLIEAVGVPVESAAISGVDGNAARAVLAQRPGLLRGKRVVVFCFSMHHLVLHDWVRVEVGGGGT